MDMHQSATAVLVATSRTFSTPILQLPPGLKEAVMSGYLCVRAADEIEDHPRLGSGIKVELLQQISRRLQASPGKPELHSLFREHAADLPEVTLRIEEWSAIAPPSIAPRVMDTAAAMADRMAYWVQRRWNIRTEADLDHYCFATAGTVGLLLSDLWCWHDGTASDRLDAVAAGRAFQGLNMLLDRDEDLARGVDFFPNGWGAQDMETYVKDKLTHAVRYVSKLPEGPALAFCKGPVALAQASLDARGRGSKRLSREEATAILADARD